MSRPIAKFLVGFALLAGLLLAMVLVQTLSQPFPAPPPLPKPNGYDDLVKASQKLVGGLADYATTNKQELQDYLAKNVEALKLAKIGLARECQVPVSYVEADFTAKFSDLGGLKHLAQTFSAGGRVAELEDRFGEAARTYSSVCVLGSKVSRGGVIIHSLVAVAIEAIGVSKLEKLVTKLDARQCCELASTLEAIDQGREPAEVVLQTERSWSRRTYGLRYGLVRLVMFKSTRIAEQRFVSKFTTQQVRTRRLIVTLGARAYELEKGERPKTFADLVPAYLKRIPQDPLTGTNLNYLP